ncbi:hypothetical protein IEO21_06072 [Rhodonia placenta]|uniref:F-box domain-containing protein n=1 Tax=Rhodonia placenta TaxID=104341 RepID=A0A8H7P0T5_9APHY|nr:hypothetical protein IEO21_06072 [Postia placenta]
MPTRIITDLPVELLVMIFFFLDARDLINCKQHMRRTAELVLGTSFPQWTALAWTTTPGGLFAQANMRGGIDFIQLPSAVLGVSERRWSVHSDRLEMEMETMCMDPSQDVVVVTGWDRVPNRPQRRYPALRILSFTDGKSHRLAARSEINLSDTGRYYKKNDVEHFRREGRQTRLEGDYVAHLGSWNYEYAVLVWDWKTGDLLWESIVYRACMQLQQTSSKDKYNSFDFIDSRHLLATEDGGIDIFVLDRPSTYTGVPVFIRGSLCMWDYPMRKGQSFTLPQLMSTHKGGCSQRNPAQPFYSSPHRGLVAVACYGAPLSADMWTEVILVPASMIREWALRAQTGAQDEDTFRVGDSGLVEWAHWAPYYPRIIRNGRLSAAEVQGMHATFATIDEELVLDHIDYTAVGGKEVEFDFDTFRDLGDEWDKGGKLCVIPEDSEGVHSAYAEARPIVEGFPQYLVILPDYAILQEYNDDDGDTQWQIYHIVASESGDL